MSKDQKDFEEWWNNTGRFIYWGNGSIFAMKSSWLAARRTLRKKIKADPSIGKLIVEDWPENPDY